MAFVIVVNQDERYFMTDQTKQSEDQTSRDERVVGHVGRAEGDVRRLRIFGGLFALVPLAMLGMSYAAVPLYQMFCQVTGYGGTTKVAQSAPDTILNKTIRIRFDANVSKGLSWRFKPVKRTLDVRIGESKVASYTAINTSNDLQVGTAAFNVTPEAAGIYFNKIECFCFTRQELKAGEEADLPVTFFIDPEIVDDPNTRHLSEITLSYTFFPNDTPSENDDAKDKQASKAAVRVGVSGG